MLREVTPEVAVTTNFMSLFRELDYWDFADAEDLVTDDAYPDPADPDAHIGAALNYGLMRSLKDGRPWLLLEQAPSAVSWREVNVPKAPGQMRLGSMQAIAHGSDGVMFFQWRQAKFGPEKFHSAMLGHRGERSRTFQETKALGAELKALAPVRGTRVRASVALIADWDSWWGVTAPDSLPSLRLDWLREARAWHAAAYALGQPVDVARAAGPYGEHRVLLVPNLYATTAEQADALAGFVAAGGQLVVGPFSGVVDHREQIHDGEPPARCGTCSASRSTNGGRSPTARPARSPSPACSTACASGANGWMRHRAPRCSPPTPTAISPVAPRSPAAATARVRPGTSARASTPKGCAPCSRRSSQPPAWPPPPRIPPSKW